jgi:hypothetical protein
MKKMLYPIINALIRLFQNKKHTGPVIALYYIYYISNADADNSSYLCGMLLSISFLNSQPILFQLQRLRPQAAF